MLFELRLILRFGRIFTRSCRRFCTLYFRSSLWGNLTRIADFGSRRLERFFTWREPSSVVCHDVDDKADDEADDMADDMADDVSHTLDRNWCWGGGGGGEREGERLPTVSPVLNVS